MLISEKKIRNIISKILLESNKNIKKFLSPYTEETFVYPLEKEDLSDEGLPTASWNTDFAMAVWKRSPKGTPGGRKMTAIPYWQIPSSYVDPVYGRKTRFLTEKKLDNSMKEKSIFLGKGKSKRKVFLKKLGFIESDETERLKIKTFKTNIKDVFYNQLLNPAWCAYEIAAGEGVSMNYHQLKPDDNAWILSPAWSWAVEYFVSRMKTINNVINKKKDKETKEAQKQYYALIYGCSIEDINIMIAAYNDIVKLKGVAAAYSGSNVANKG